MSGASIVEDTEESESPGVRPRLTLWILAAALVGAVVGGLLLNAWERASAPEVFYSAPSSVSTWNNHEPLGKPNSFGMTYTMKHLNAPVTILSAIPIVAENSSRATFRVSVCSPDLSKVGAIGSSYGDLHRYCTKLIPADGATMSLVTNEKKPATPDQVVLTIIANQPGTVVVKGLDLRYVQDGRQARQTVGEFIRLRAST